MYIYFQEQKRIAIWNMKFMENQRQFWRIKDRVIHFRGEGEIGSDCCKQKSPLEETERLKCSGFSLTDL